MIKQILNRINLNKEEKKKEKETKEFLGKPLTKKKQTKAYKPADEIEKKVKYGLSTFGIVVFAIIIFIAKKQTPMEPEESYTVGYDGNTLLKTTDDMINESTRQSTTSVGSPEVPVPTAVPSSAITEDGYYNNAYYKYTFEIPSGFDVYESQNILYLRDLNTYTQISVIYLDEEITDPVDVYNRNSTYMDRQKALLAKEGEAPKERTLIQWARGYLENTTVGEYNIRKEIGTGYYMEEKDRIPLELKTCDYYAVFNGNGVCITGISQTLDTDTIFQLMDEVLTSISVSTEENTNFEYTIYKDKKSGVSFSYPKDWDVSENDDGMVIIKAPNTQSSSYAGCVIEFVADKGKIVDSYTQFSGSYETQILLPTFIQEIKESDFDYETAVTKMEMNAKIKNMDCYYFEITDRVFPKSIGIFDSLSILGDTLYSKRWCFKANGYNCMLNVIQSTSGTDISDTITQSLKN